MISLENRLLRTGGSQFVLVCSFILEHFVFEQAQACGAQGVRQGANPLQPPRPFYVGRVELASLKHATRPYQLQEQLRQINVN